MKNILTKICIVCGKEFEKSVNCSRKEWSQKRFCSKSCVSKYFQNGKGTRFSKERHFVPKTAFKKGKHSSSKTEFQKGLIPWNRGKKGVMPTPWNKDIEFIAIQGNKHWNWQGGRIELKNQIRSLLKYKQWRKSIFSHDNWTCVECRAKRRKGNRVVLHADHIKPFYKILIENNVRTIEQAKKCVELWNVKNGRTLCVPCHKQTPSYLLNQYTLK